MTPVMKRWHQVTRPAIQGMVMMALLASAGPALARIQVRVADNPSGREQLAVAEIQRYLYLRTGDHPERLAQDGQIVVARKDSPLLTDPAVRSCVGSLQPQQYVIKTTLHDGKRSWWIIGGDDTGALYGAYRFCEKLGVRFYLHGDVIPDQRLAALPEMDETGKPLFPLRGLNPWGAHPFGIDAWSADDYKAILSQITKMRMNFLGLHCYPKEPLVWLGRKEDFDAQGKVNASYVPRFYNTLAKSGWGPILPKKTSEFSFGAAQLFEDDAWSPDILKGYCPQPETEEASNEVFNRMAAQLKDAFSFARELDIKTAIGHEVPTYTQPPLRDRLKARGKVEFGKDGIVKTPEAFRELYQGVFRRIAASHPLDYYWMWTPENWTTYEGNTRKEYEDTVRDFKDIIQAHKDSGVPFKLATCGWVLGPQHDRAAFDQDLPKDVPVSAISRCFGWWELDEAFGRVQGRDKWGILWLESDTRHALAGVQLFAGRLRRDAADALAYGCTGLMGVQWRTDILAPNAAALANAGWDQTGWNPAPGQLPVKMEEGALGEEAAEIATDVLGNIPEKAKKAAASKVENPSDAQAITGTPNPGPYRNSRYGMKGYQLKLPNGRYSVTLQFCEAQLSKKGERVAHYRLQGRMVVQDLDIFERVGKFAALDVKIENIDVTDGWLRLEAVRRQGIPALSGIVVEGPAVTRRINCGGPAVGDYEADLAVIDLNQKRNLPCDDLYADWVVANFGSEAGADIARVFASLDGRLPISVGPGCPAGSLKPAAKPWPELAPEYEFVGTLEQLKARVVGAGNRDRYEWWLNTFRYYRSLQQIRCMLGEFEALLKKQKLNDAVAKYKEMIGFYGEISRLLLATVNTPGGLGMVVNFENNDKFWNIIVVQPAQKLEKALNHPLAEEFKPSKRYAGQPRIIVPTVRSVLRRNESLKLKFIVLDNGPAKAATVYWRPMGEGEFNGIEAKPIARGVYGVELPPIKGSVEYRIEAQTADGTALIWPATAPTMNQTLVAW